MSHSTETGTGTFVQKLKLIMEKLQPIQTSNHHTKQSTFIHKDLRTCSHVFIRHDAVGPVFQPPYDGPFEVLKRTEKVYKVCINGKEKAISIDRLKPAYIANEQEEDNHNQPINLPKQPPEGKSSEQSKFFTTRAGRKVTFMNYRCH